MSQTKITKKLEQLEILLNQIEEARAVNSNDPETWDSDILYNLEANCEAALELLRDQRIKGKFDERSPSAFDKDGEFGQPLYQDGLLSLVDEWNN